MCGQLLWWLQVYLRLSSVETRRYCEHVGDDLWRVCLSAEKDD